MAGSDYNAIYIKGDYSLNSPTTISFDMTDNGAFEVNDSILGENVFTVAITGDNKSTFIMNDNITAKQQYIYSPRSSVDLNDVTLELGTAHGGATDGSIYVDKLNVNGNTDIDMLGSGNTIEVLSTNIAKDTELNIDAGAIAANSTGNVKTGTLTMGEGSSLNLTGDTFMTASGNTSITNATVKVGGTSATSEDTKLHLATTTATDSTITVTDSEFKAGTTTLTNTDFTATTSTAEFGNLTASENVIDVFGDSSKLTAETTKLTNTILTVTDGEGVSFGDLTATGESITVTNADITAGDTTLTGTSLSATGGQNAIFGDLSATGERITISNATFTAGKTMMDGTDLTVTSANSVTMDSLTASDNIMNFGSSTPSTLAVAGHVNLDASTTTLSNSTGTFGTKKPNWNDPKDFVTLTTGSALSVKEKSNITMQEFSASGASSLSVDASTVKMNTLTANADTTLDVISGSALTATTTKLDKTELTVTDSKSSFGWFETSNGSTITVSGTNTAQEDSITTSGETRLTDSTIKLTNNAKGRFTNTMDLTRSELNVDSGASAYIKESLLGDGSTVTIDGASLTVQEYYSTAVEFANSTLTLENGATGTFINTYGSSNNGVMEIADKSAFIVESDSKVELGNVSAANGSSVLIDNATITGIGSYYANEFEDSSLTVSNGATANFSGDIELDSGILSVSGGSTITMDKLSGKNDSEITVDGAGTSLTSTWVQSGYSSYGNPKLNNTSLTFTNGATGIFAGRLDLTNSPVEVSGGSDLTASTGLMSYGKDKNSITVTGIGSTLTANGYSTLSGATMTVDATADATFETLRGYSDSKITVADAGSSMTATKELTLSATALTVKDEATLTAGKGTFTASPLTIENKATASFDDKLEFKGSEVSVTGTSSLTSTSTEPVAFNISTWPAATGFLKVEDASTATFGGGGSFTSTDVSVTGGSTAIFGKYFKHKHTTGDTTIVDHYDGELKFVNSDLTVTFDDVVNADPKDFNGTTFYAGSATMDNGTLTMSEGVKVNMGKGGLHFSNGGAIKVIGGETTQSNKPHESVAALNLHGDLVLDNSFIEVTDGADLDIYFYKDGNTIAGTKGSINEINVSGDGSTLHVSLQNGTSQTPKLFDDVILNVKDNAIFEVDGLDFKFTGGASADEVVNLSVSDGAHAVFDKLAIETADVDVTNAGDKASAFVAEELTFVDSTFTVSQSYAQVNSLLSAEPSGSSGSGTTGSGTTGGTGPSLAPPALARSMPIMMRSSSSLLASEDSYLGNGTTTSSDLRIAAGGVFVLGDVGSTTLTPPTTVSEAETTAKELLLGLKATNAESAGATGAATGHYDPLTQGTDKTYGITLDPNHSAFTVTGGERLTINKGSSLIIDADAASKIEGGANKYLLDNVPLYIGHDDILLIDNIDKGYNVLEGQPQGVITIADSGLDTAYILSADSKIRVIVKNGYVEEKTFAVIYDKNHASDATHTISGNDYKGDIYFTLGDKDNLGDKNENYFSTCKHVNGGGAGYTDDNRITTKTYKTIIMQNVDFTTGGEIGATIPAGQSYVDDEKGKYTVYEFKMGIDGYKPNFGVEDELYKSLVEVYKAKDSSLNADDDATRFLTKTTVYATEKHDRDAAIKLGSVTEIAVVGGVANMANDVMTTSTDALGRYLDYGINATGAYDEKGSFSLWGIPLYSQSKVDGIEVGSIEGGYEQELIAGVVGIDLSNTSGRIGLSFTGGAGESSSTKDFLQTENDTTFYGGGLYGQYKFGSFAVRADLGYYVTEGNLEQESCGYSDFGKVTADVDATIMTAGFDTSYLFSFNESWALKPHAGVRYSLYSQDKFTSEVNGNDFFTTDDADMSIISVPLGVSLLTSFGIGDWNFQPRLDASIIFNFGDTVVDNNVSAPSLQSFGTANIEADILDEYTLSGSVGMDANYGDFTIGLDYNMQQSDRRTAHGVFGTIRYEF